MKNINFLVEKKNIYQVSSNQRELTELQEGEIRLKIDQYALTSNNISYAASGFEFRYWDFTQSKNLMVLFQFGAMQMW